jgi:hypothetical protein
MSKLSRRRFGMARAWRRLVTRSTVVGVALLAGVVVAAVPAHADLDCTPSLISFEFGSPTVKFGDGTTLSWSSPVPAECGMAYELNGPTPDTFSQVVGASGSIVIAATMLGFGDNEWSLRSYIPGTEQAWNLAARSVTVTMPDPLPNGSQVTIADDGPASRVTFVRAVMAPDAKVRIAGTVNLNLSTLVSIPVARGVQIVGDRSVVAAGPRLFTTTIPRELLKVGDNSDGVHISGIRLEGGQSDDPFSGVGPLDSDGIGVYASQHVEIDHSELYHWRGAAVNVHDGNTTDDPLYRGRLNQDTVEDDSLNVWVHDNYIHHNQHPSADTCIDGGGHAGGYGVEAADGAYVKIERNVFDWNRHSIAGDGKSGTGYVARDNLILQGGGVHFKCVDPGSTLWALALNPFAAVVYVVAQALDGGSIYHTHAIDMHATGNCKNGVFVGELNQWGDHNCGQAGEYMDVEYNTVLYTAGNGIHLRGTPVRALSSPAGTTKVGMDVKYNVFAHTVHDGGFITPGAVLRNEEGLYELGNTLGLNTYNSRKFCDFDGDGTVDSMIATGVTWWYAASRLGGRWTYLARSSARTADITVRDVNGDGRCDAVGPGGDVHFGGDGLVLDSANGTATPGASVTTQVGFTASAVPGTPVTLTTSVLPQGVRASFNPTAVSSAHPTSTLTLTNLGAVAGTYPVRISAGSAAAVTYQLKVQDFSLSLTPASGTLAQGHPVTTQVRLNPLNGYTGSVNLSAPGLPTGMTASFSPATVSPANPVSTLTVTLTSTFGLGGPEGIVIAGTPTTGGLERTATYLANIDIGYSVAISLQTGSVDPGVSTTTEVTYSGWGNPATLSTKELPDEVTVSFDPPVITGQERTSIVTITADKNASPGTYMFWINAGPFSFWYQLAVGDGGNI